MAAAASRANANSNANSPRHLSENLDSHRVQSRCAPAAASSPPWTQIVRGESDLMATASSSPHSSTTIEQDASASSSSPHPHDEDKSENGGEGQGNAGRRPAWNRPSNVAADVGPVMGAEAWPPLSELARTPSNKSSSDSSKSLPEISSLASVSQKQVRSNANTYSGGNYTHPSRSRSFRRNNSMPSSNGLLHSPAQGALSEGSSTRLYSQRNGSGTHSHVGNDHHQHRNNHRNQNGGNHLQSYGNRRNQEHGNQSWNPHRSFSGRDARMQSQRGLPRFMVQPPPPISTPFIASPPVRSFSPIGLSEMGSQIYYFQAFPTAPPESFRGVPFVAPIPPVFYPVPDPELRFKILNQIHFYFSDANLIKDVFLRKNMDAQGWVSIELIAGFKKVEALTKNVPLILDVLQSSSLVEVKDDKIRRRNDWPKWLIPKSVLFPDCASPHSMGRLDNDILAHEVQNLSLDQSVGTNDVGRIPETQLQASSLSSQSLPLGKYGASGNWTVASISATKSD